MELTRVPRYRICRYPFAATRKRAANQKLVVCGVRVEIRTALSRIAAAERCKIGRRREVQHRPVRSSPAPAASCWPNSPQLKFACFVNATVCDFKRRPNGMRSLSTRSRARSSSRFRDRARNRSLRDTIPTIRPSPRASRTGKRVKFDSAILLTTIRRGSSSKAVRGSRVAISERWIIGAAAGVSSNRRTN